MEQRILENIVNIALTAGVLTEMDIIEIPDSTDFPIQVERLAREFEEQYEEEIQDYLGAIDLFAREKLEELYGIEEEEIDEFCPHCQCEVTIKANELKKCPICGKDIHESPVEFNTTVNYFVGLFEEAKYEEQEKRDAICDKIDELAELFGLKEQYFKAIGLS